MGLDSGQGSPSLSTSLLQDGMLCPNTAPCPVPRLALTRYSSLTFSWHLTYAS